MLAESTAALLALGRPLDQGALLLTATALLTLGLRPTILPPGFCLFLVVIAGLAEHFFALRTTFDQPVFAAWGQRWREPGASPEVDLADFDAALVRTGLRAAPSQSRSLDERVAGARRLLWRQGLCCVLQVAGWLATVVLPAVTP